MKKFLSMVLALVMVMSLVTISAGAEGFTDDSKIQYQEAVDVMSAVKVIDGYEDGSFNPQGTLTRGAAAKIICNLILGPTTASALSADTAPYKDVPVNHTFAGYIAYCQQQGIISGYADGTFRPAATLTNYAFMKMLLGALGYDSSIEGYVGDNWSIQVAKRALAIGLDDGLVEDFVGTQAATREQACLYALNTMTADMVDYDSRTSVTVGGAEVVIAGSKAETVVNSAKNETIYDDDVMQFGEKYFSDLKLNDNATDDFARPANQWKIKAEEIGTYTQTPDASYTKKVEAGDIYKDLGLGSTIDKADVEIYVDGVEDSNAAPVAIKKSSDTKVGVSGNGVLTEVFYDDDDDSVIITQINTYVGEVVKTVAETSKKDAYVVISLDSKPASLGSGNQEFETNEEFEDEAKVLYTYSLSADEVKSLATAELVSGTASRVENKKNNTDENKAIYIEDTKYSFSVKSAGVALEDASVDVDYDVYLDAYGYAIYVEEIDEIGDYALLMDYQNKGNFSTNKALLVFADGTEKIVETAKDYKSAGSNQLALGTIVTYKENDGEYTLKPVTQTVANATLAAGGAYPNITFGEASVKTDFDMKNDRAGIVIADAATDKYYSIDKTGSKTAVNTVGDGTSGGAKTVNANSKTIFVVYNKADDDYSVYTGIKNAPTIKSTAAAQAAVFTYAKNGMTKVMFIFVPDSSIVEDENTNMIFLAGESVSNLIHVTGNSSSYFEYDAVVNGEITTVKVASDVVIDGTGVRDEALAGVLNGLFKSYSVDKYDVITRLTTYDTYTTGNNKSAINGDVNRTISTENSAGTTVTHTLAAAQANAVGINKRSADYTVILGTTSGVNATITVDDDAKIYYVDEDGNISESSYNAISKDEDDLAYAVVQDYLVKYLLIEEVNTKNNAQAATVSVSGKTTATVGDEVVLTANVTLADSKYDSIQGYQWYSSSDDVTYTAIAGETGKTLTVSAAAAGTTYYKVDVTTFNDKVDGKDTAVGTSAAHTLVVSAAPVADMTVTVKTYLRDAGGNIPLDETTQTISADTTINAPEYAEYTVYGASSKAVTFVEGGSATVTFVYNAKAVTKIEVTTQPTSTEVTSGNDFDPTGMVVTATYDNGTTADVTSKVTLSGNTGITVAGDVTVSYTENGTTVTTTVAVTVAP